MRSCVHPDSCEPYPEAQEPVDVAAQNVSGNWDTPSFTHPLFKNPHPLPRPNSKRPALAYTGLYQPESSSKANVISETIGANDVVADMNSVNIMRSSQCENADPSPPASSKGTLSKLWHP